MTHTAAPAPPRPAGRHARPGTDRGSATGWAIGTILVGLLIVALLFDAAAAMSTRAAALDTAQQAARAGADQLDLTLLRASGQVAIDPAAAHTTAQQWLQQAGTEGTVAATPAQVEVTVTLTQPTVLLAAVGVPTFTITATATARPLTGS